MRSLDRHPRPRG